MQIETARLVLRELTMDDHAALTKVLADSDNMRHYPYMFDAARVTNWIVRNIERYQIFGFGLWAVVLKETGEMIGDCGLSMQEVDRVIRPEIGYHIARVHQHKGYAKEAAAAVRDWAFANTPFQILCSYMTADNIPSQNTAKSIGMTFEKAYGKDVVYSQKRPITQNQA